MLHGGDNDSMGIIAGAIWGGTMYGYEGVPESHHNDLEYRDRIAKLSIILLKKAHGISSKDSSIQDTS